MKEEGHKSNSAMEEEMVVESVRKGPCNTVLSRPEYQALEKGRGDEPMEIDGGSSNGFSIDGPKDQDHCSNGSSKAMAESRAREKLCCRKHGGLSPSSSRREKIEVGRSFQLAVCGHDWGMAESLIPLADTQRLNDGLCIALDSVWFLRTWEELSAVTRLIEKLIEAGAQDFTRATLRTSFLASCVSAWRSQTMSLSDTVSVMAQRLHERLEECSGVEILKADAAAKVQRFTEWALKCIGSLSRTGKEDNGNQRGFCHSSLESQLQLRVFRRFLELAGNGLTGKDYTEAFDAACFPLTLFTTELDSGPVTGTAANAMQGLLGLLVEGGADNVNQCFLEAARFGSTELVRTLLQIAQRNGIEVDVDLALGFAAHHFKFSTMDCLVDDGHANAFLGPLMRAADRGSMQVVRWFIERGCRDMELCLALTAAASSCRLELAAYLLDHIPLVVLHALSLEILKAAGERSKGSLEGVTFLLQSNFLGNPIATYEVADSIAKMEDDDISSDLKSFFRNEWSVEAFLEGRMTGKCHYLNMMRVLHRGSSPLQLEELPLQLQVAIAYYPLYKECVDSKGPLPSQRLRGQLVDAVLRLDGGKFFSSEEILVSNKYKLLAVLASRLPPFLISDVSEQNMI